MNHRIQFDHSSFQSIPIAWVTLVIALAITFLSWAFIKNASQKHIKSTIFDYRVEQVKNAIIHRMFAYQQVLEGGVGLFAASDLVTRQEWHDYAENLHLARNYPGIQGFGFSQHILPADKAVHIAEIRTVNQFVAEGFFQSYTIRPTGEREEYTSIIYLEPFNRRNQYAIGYDMFSEPVRRIAMVRARDSGEAALSGKVTLVQEIDQNIQAGCLLYIPVYRKDQSHETLEEKRAALIGYVYSPFRMNDLMQGIFGEQSLGIDFEIYDGDLLTDFNPERLMYDAIITQTINAGYFRLSPFTKVEQIRVAGHTWTILFAALPDFEFKMKTYTPNIVLLGGIMMSFLLFGTLRFLENRRLLVLQQQANTLLQTEIRERQQIELILRQRDEDLQEVQAMAHIGSWILNVATQQVFWSEGIYQIFKLDTRVSVPNYTDQQHLFPPESWEKLDRHLSYTIRTGIPYEIELEIVKADGSCGWIVARGKAQRDEAGTVTKVYGMIQDVTQQKLAETSLKKQHELLKISEQKLQIIFNILDVGITITDEQGNVIDCNQSSEVLLGISKAEHLHRNYASKEWQIIRPDFTLMPPQEFASVRALNERRAVSHIEMGIVKSDGEITWILVSAIPMNIKGYGVVISYFDITARKRAEQQLQDSEFKWRQLLKKAPLPLCIVNSQGRFEYLNDRFTEVLGYSLEDIPTLEQWWLKAYPDADYRQWALQSWNEAAAKSLSEKREVIDLKDVEYCVTCKNGEVRAITILVIMFREGFLATFIDMTERKRMEQALRESQERLDFAMRGANDGIWDWNFVTSEVYRSPRFKQLFGLTEEDEMGTRFEEFSQQIHPDDHQGFKTALTAYLEKQVPHYQVIFRLRHKQGHYFWGLSRASAVWDENGKPLRMVGVLTDITPLKQAEMAVDYQRNLLQAILDSLDTHIAVLDAKGMIINVNRVWRQFSENNGLAPSHNYGMGINYLDLCATATQYSEGEQAQIAFTGIQAVLSGEQPIFSMEYPCHIPHKQNWFKMIVSPLREVAGGVVISHEDITQSKILESSLRQAKEHAEAANRAKSTFLANMSHELRTPLNGILGYAQILVHDRTLTEEQQHSAKIIEHSGEYLLTLINDVLDLARVESGKTELSPTIIELEELLEGISHLFSLRAENKGIDFRCEIVSELPVAIYADEKKLRQVIINLLGNAFKFTQQGYVTLTVGYQQGELNFQVEDSGCGLAPEDLNKIFNPFQQVGYESLKKQGTGLGLAITKGLVEMMKGTLQVHSVLGQGSIFSMSFKLPEVPTVLKSAQPAAATSRIIGYQGEHRTLLIIDDNAISRSVLIKILTRLGFTILEAESGQEGLNIVQQCPQFDAILVDLIMPELHGFSVIEQLRMLPQNRTTTLIAISASAFEADRQRSLELGCNAFIAKPIKFDLLLECLRVHLNLTWLYEQETVVKTDSFSEVMATPLTPAQAAELLELTKQGDIIEICNFAEQLEQSDENLAAFARYLHELATSFKVGEIRKIVSSLKIGDDKLRLK